MDRKREFWQNIFIFFLYFACTKSQEERCTDTPYNITIGEEVKCPAGKVEVYEEGNWEYHWKTCCFQNTTGEKNAIKSALGCQVTSCTYTSNEPCSDQVYWRKYKGERISYEEISRDTCTNPDDGEQGITGYCCRKNSTQGLLATTYGAEFNEFPFMACVSNENGCCGGTIYNKRYVITAAHCIVDEDSGEVNSPSDYQVKVGRNMIKVKMPENDYSIEAFIIHPEYSRLSNHSDFESGLYYNDIALLKLNRDIQFGERVKSLQIAPKGFEELEYSNTAVVVGWGTTDTGEVSDIMQKANFILRRDEACFGNSTEEIEAPWNGDFKQSKGLLCVGGLLEGKFSPVAGRGDSGGPAVCRGKDGFGVLCGVTSFGDDDDECINNVDVSCKPSVYAELDFFQDWIEKTAGKQEVNTFHKRQLYGEVVPRDKYEHQIHITSDEGKPCGGTLIGADIIVTAAQCVARGDGSNKTYSNIKATTRQEGAKPIGILKLSILPGFKRIGDSVNVTAQGFRVVRTDNIYRNDLAVLKLKEKVSLDPKAFAGLPRTGDFPENPTIELSFLRDNDLGRKSELRKREFNISSQAECQKRIDRLVKVGVATKVAKNILCGVETYSGGSTCDRELGGGLICKGNNGKDVLCGVQVYRLCEWSVPNGFVDVAQYSTWIDNFVKSST
ncbi:unnamed protein product [Orchesella dallaii]|uniref:Peptidase S1 domain-containing protein n=1 Tax=Orchesella dallaii TaxID=48710 RepID=A0ABP1RUW7_9HEXA